VESIVRKLRPHNEIFTRCLAGPDELHKKLLELPGVERIRRERDGVAFDFEGDLDDTAALLADLVRAGLRPVEFAPQVTDLEDVFLSLTEGKVQ
jgi:hypothetical protein